MHDYLDSRDIKYHIFIIEQDNAKLFNRGMLLNIGFKYAVQHKCNYVVFHDVDMLPIDVDYNFSDVPLHLATDFTNEDRTSFEEYFGGVTMFPVDTFVEINGYSNKYWGWGFEDDDLLYRCIKKGVNLETLSLKNYKPSETKLKFNGVNAYVRGKNKFRINKSRTYFISFQPDEITCDHTKVKDEFPIFSIPGYDFTINYNSFSRYNFCIFNKELQPFYVNSKIIKNYYTTFALTIDTENEIIKIYQDAELIGSIVNFGKLYPYKKEQYFYLGINNPNIDNPNYFKGLFDKFIVVDGVLKINDIKKLHNNDINDLKEKFVLWYDTNVIEEYKLIDLTYSDNDGEIFECEIANDNVDEYKKIKKPYRRKSIFKSQIHEQNGFLNNQWKDQNTRWNQLRFVNEVKKNDELLLNDGLSDLVFVEHGVIKDDKNITTITVGI